MDTLVAVAPEPKPSTADDLMAFLELIDPELTRDEFFRRFEEKRNQHYRRGQFFMSVLPTGYNRILTGSLVDPFYADDWESVFRALDYLLDRI